MLISNRTIPHRVCAVSFTGVKTCSAQVADSSDIPGNFIRQRNQKRQLLQRAAPNREVTDMDTSALINRLKEYGADTDGALGQQYRCLITMVGDENE